MSETGQSPVPKRAALVEPLQYARVLVAMGELREAEWTVAEALDADPEDLEALGLLAKIKHIKGEISEAVAYWSQIQARSRRGDLARMHLASMLNLALDPERGAGEFLAVGQYQLVRKPMAYLALEEAFRLHVSRQPSEARAHCRRVAKKYQGRDREIYKLAVLAEAWIAELSGEAETACGILERLGLEQGFQTDHDRVIALVDLYEQIGTPERLEAAVNICHFLERAGGGPAVMGRLSSLYRRLDHPERASRHEAQHHEAFLRAIHRATLTDLVHVAAQRYLPLASLQTALSSPGSPRDDITPVEQALMDALEGNLDRAHAALAATEGTLLERKYVAELLVLLDKPEAAAAAYDEILHQDPEDLHLIRHLIGHAERQPWLDEILHDPKLAAALRDTLSLALQLDPRDSRLWRSLATLAELGEPAEATHIRSADRASALEAVAREKACPIGRVLAAAVYHFVGKGHGVIHEIWVGREPVGVGKGGALPRDRILGNVTTDMKSAVANTFLAVREYARATLPHLVPDILDFNYTFKVTKDDEASSGTSAGLPAALAFLSVFLQRPVRQDMAFTGVIVADAHDVLLLRKVGDIAHKVQGACQRDLRGIVVPEENRADLEVTHVIPVRIRDEICLYASRLDDAVEIVFGPETLR